MNGFCLKIVIITKKPRECKQKKEVGSRNSFRFTFVVATSVASTLLYRICFSSRGSRGRRPLALGEPPEGRQRRFLSFNPLSLVFIRRFYPRVRGVRPSPQYQPNVPAGNSSGEWVVRRVSLRVFTMYRQALPFETSNFELRGEGAPNLFSPGLPCFSPRERENKSCLPPFSTKAGKTISCLHGIFYCLMGKEPAPGIFSPSPKDILAAMTTKYPTIIKFFTAMTAI